MNKKQYIANSEIEQALFQDNAGIYRDNLLTTFSTEKIKITQALNRGVKPDEYAILSGLLMAIEEAITIVNKMWFNFQNNNN